MRFLTDPSPSTITPFADRPRPPNSLFPNYHDWTAFGQSRGRYGETVRAPAELQGAFPRALDHHVPTVIGVKADKQCKTPVMHCIVSEDEFIK